MRNREDDGPDAHEEDSAGDPAGLVARTSQVGDRDEAEDGRDVVADDDQAGLLTRQAEAALDGRYDDVDEPIHQHALWGGVTRLSPCGGTRLSPCVYHSSPACPVGRGNEVISLRG